MALKVMVSLNSDMFSWRSVAPNEQSSYSGMAHLRQVGRCSMKCERNAQPIDELAQDQQSDILCGCGEDRTHPCANVHIQGQSRLPVSMSNKVSRWQSQITSVCIVGEKGMARWLGCALSSACCSGKRRTYHKKQQKRAALSCVQLCLSAEMQPEILEVLQIAMSS